MYGKMKVLIGYNPIGLAEAIPDLRRKYPGVEFAHCASREDTGELIVDADVYVGWLNRDVFLAAKKLKWIQSPSTGVDYFLTIPELVDGAVLLTNARGTHAACLAESTLGMILAFTRGIRDSVLHQQRREWIQRAVRPRLVELTGSTMGIVGFGTIGRALAERAQAFGVRVIATDLYPVDKPDYVAELWNTDRLSDLLSESDYVVVTVPYIPENHGLIGSEQLALMKPTAMLVGVSRGGIIDQTALVRALREKRLAAAALDVFRPEPLPADSELWDVENLLITPHIAGGTQFEGQYVLDILVENLARFLRGDLPLRNQVDKQRGF
jgi:phosphoglycerate dehydrogenase-like enzyme